MAQEHFHNTSLLKPAAQGVGWIFQLRCPDHFAHTACFPALNHGPDSPPLLCTIHYSPSSAAAKQLNQQHLTRGNLGKQQRPCPHTVTFCVSNRRKVIPVLEGVTHPKTTDTRHSLEVFSVGSQVFWGQQRAHATLEWLAFVRQTLQTQRFCMWKCWVYYLHRPWHLAAIQYSSWEIPGKFSINPLFAEGLPHSTTLPYGVL